MKSYRKMLTGLAGECATMTELCMREWVPSLAYNNSPKFDIFCFNQDTGQTICIQVKTVREKAAGGKISSFPIMGNRDEREPFYKDDVVGPYVFVYIDKDNHFSYYILSKEQFVETSREVERKYDEIPRVKEIKDGSPMAMPKKEIEKFENQWDNLWL